MSKIQTISGRSSFATVCETARRMGYRLLVCSNSKTYLLKGWKVAVVPTEKVAEYLQAQAPQNPVNTPEIEPSKETEPNKPTMPAGVIPAGVKVGDSDDPMVCKVELKKTDSDGNEETDSQEASDEEARAIGEEVCDE